MDLKDRAIYQLPNGRELIAQVSDGEVVFSNLSADDDREYQLNSEGRLIFDGQLTAWDTNDLVETGRVATRETAQVLAEAAQTFDEQSV